MSGIDVGRRDLAMRKAIARAINIDKETAKSLDDLDCELVDMQYEVKKVIKGTCTDLRSGTPYKFEFADGVLTEIEFADND